MNVIAIDTGGTRIKIALILDDKVVETFTLSSPVSKEYSEVLSLSAQAIKASNIYQKNSFSVIGLAFAGIVNMRENRIVVSNDKNKNAEKLDITAWGKENFSLPVFVLNDATAALMGEVAFGCVKGVENVSMMILGTGIGTASRSNGVFLSGYHGSYAALFGHMTIDFEGKIKCNCPNSGCLESFAGTWALDSVREYLEKDVGPSELSKVKHIDYRVLEEYYKKEDELAIIMFQFVVKALGIGIVNLIHAYDPEKVVLSGGPTHFKELIPPIREYVKNHTWSPWPSVEIVVSDTPEASVVLGLNAYVKEKLNVKN